VRGTGIARIVLALVLAGALGELGAACSGSSGSSSATTESTVTETTETTATTSTETETTTTASTETETSETDTTETDTTETDTTETDTTETGTTTGGPEPLSKDEYSKLMRTYGQDVGVGLRNVFEATTPEQTSSALSDGQRKLKRAANRMATLVPPTDVATQHAKLVQGIRAFAADLARAERQFRNGNVRGVTTLASSAALRTLQTAYDAIVKKGYDLDSG
jgi:hypothetical protein